jgi:hypothetical protein
VRAPEPSVPGFCCFCPAGCFELFAGGGGSSFGAVRELRFGAAAPRFGRGISLRVTNPWPVVQRFVVIQ